MPSTVERGEVGPARVYALRTEVQQHRGTKHARAFVIPGPCSLLSNRAMYINN